MDKYLENELLSQAEAISNFGIWELDLTNNKLYWSDGVFRICGYEPQEFEVTLEKGLSVIHPEEREFTVLEIQKTIDLGEDFDLRKRFITKQGDIKYINSKGKIIKDNNGNAIKLRGVFQDITHVVYLESTLKKTNDDLKTLIENTPDIIYSFDLDFKLLTYNSAFVNIVENLGLGKVAKGVNIFELYTNEKIELYSAVFLIVKEGKRYIFEDELLIDGQPTFFDVSVNPILNSENQVIGVSIFSKDITEKKQKEKELERIKFNQEYIINNTRDLMWSINDKMQLITANNAFHKMVNDATGKNINEGDYIMVSEFPDEINNKWINYYKRGLDGETFTIKYEEETLNGIFYSLISFSPMLNDHNKVLGLACYSKNITEETINLIQLEKTKEELQKIMNSSLDVICTFNKESEFVKVNAASERVWGYKPEELIGKHYNLLVHPDDIDLTSTTTEEIQDGINVLNFENRTIKKDGTIIPMIWSANYDEKEEMTYCVAKDASAIKSKDAEIKRTNDTLKNAQRIAKIGNYELNLNTNEVFCSDEIYNIYEIDRSENEIFSPQDFISLTHPDDIVPLTNFKEDIIKTGEANAILHRIITKKNNLKYVRQVVEMVYDEKTNTKWLYGTLRDSTSNVMAQKEIENSREKYRYLFDNNPSAMFIFDFETQQIIDCNQEALELYGYTKEEFLKLNIRDIRPNEDIDLINKATSNEEAYGQIHKDTWRHQKKNGELMYVNVSGHLLDFDSKRSSLVQITDITEKLIIEKAIKASEKQKELIMNSALDAIICINKKGEVTFWNPQAEYIFGWTDKEVMGKNLTELIVPNVHRNAHEAGMKHYLKTKEGPVLNKLLELSAINKSGNEFPIELTIIPIQQENDEFFCSFIRDISERKAAELKIKESENRYKLLFQNSPLSKWVYDIEEFRFQDVNEIAITHYGYSREEFLNMTLSDIRPKEDIPKLLEIRKTIKDREGILSFGIFNHQKKDKTIIKVEVTGQKISYLGKDCMIVVCNDVTKRELAIKQLQEKEKKLLNAQKIAKLGYWQLNIDTKEIYWSEEVYHIWEREKENFTPSFTTFFDTIHPDDQLNLLNNQNAAIENGKGLDVEHRIILPNGKIKWVHEKGELLINEFGKSTSFEGTVQDITKEKNLELSLIESNQRFQYVSKATFDAIWDWDLKTDLIYWGEGFKSIFGYEPSEIEPDISSWTNRIHPDDYQRVIKSIHFCINDNDFDDNWTEDYRFLKSDGNYAFVQDKGIVIRDHSGIATRMVGAMQNITKKKQEDLRLKLLESVVTNTNDAVLITEAEPFDEPGPRILYVNEAFTKMTGYTSEEIIGKTPRILQGPKSDKNELKKLSKAIRNWERYEITTINYKKNGEEFYITFSVSPVADSKGWFTHWIAIERDVTENVVAQQKLQASYEERNTILESIGDAFFAVDKNWVVNYWNSQAEIMLATAKHHVLGKNLWEVFTNSVGSISYEKYNEALEKNISINFEDYYRPLDNWYDISVYPSENGLSIYFKDITEKKKAEFKLLDLNQLLLKQTKELALSNQELEQFAYVASHDLQEPLRMITGFLTQIDKKYGDSIDERGKQYIHFAVDGAKRMRQIILDLLEFSRVGRFSEDVEEIDIEEIIKEIRLLFRKQIEEVSASIEFGNLPKILSYKTPIRQILQNLISNSLKYHTSNIETQISIDLEDKGTFWKFSVKDNGIGIDEEYYQKIFIIFQRLHHKDEYSGTGMGLAICKKIIENLGGKIWVEKNQDLGSTFYFTILK